MKKISILCIALFQSVASASALASFYGHNDREAIEQELLDSIMLFRDREMACDWEGSTQGNFQVSTRLVVDFVDPVTREFSVRMASEGDPKVESWIYVAHHKVDFEIPRLKKNVTVDQSLETTVIDYTFTGSFYDNVMVIKERDVLNFQRRIRFEYRKTFHDGGYIGSVICESITY